MDITGLATETGIPTHEGSLTVWGWVTLLPSLSASSQRTQFPPSTSNLPISAPYSDLFCLRCQCLQSRMWKQNKAVQYRNIVFDLSLGHCRINAIPSCWYPQINRWTILGFPWKSFPAGFSVSSLISHRNEITCSLYVGWHPVVGQVQPTYLKEATSAL